MVTALKKYKGPSAQIFAGMTNGHVRLPSSAPFKYVPVADADGNETITVEGFASTDNVDRQNEVVDPSKFDLEQITTTTAVLVNHSLWRDRRGNAVAPGVIQAAYHVKVRRGSEKGQFKLYDLVGKTALKEVSRRDLPGIQVGDAGLYVVIEVTDPDVVRQVKEGRLQAFSWRGHVKKETAFDVAGGHRYVTYSLIDCWEISLVNVPVNPTSSMLIRKSMISAVSYGEMTDVDEIRRDLSNKDLDDFDLLKSGQGYYAVPKGFELIQKSEGSYTETPIGNGLSLLIVADASPETTVDSFKSLFGDTSEVKEPDMSDDVTKPTSTDELVNAVKSQIMGEISPMIASQNDAIKSLGDSLTKTVETVSAFDGKFDSITKSLTELTSAKPEETTAPKKVETPEPENDAVEEPVAAKSDAESDAKVAELSATLEETQKSVAAMATMIETVAKGVSKIVPNASDREEEVSDPPAPKSRNDVFNPLFGIPG